MEAVKASSTTYLDVTDQIVKDVIEPNAIEVDQNGTFPRESFDALGQSGLLGLISAIEVGGLGQGFRAAVEVVERVSRACASSGMVLCMHYAATAVLEAYGPREIREAIAAGKHLTTLAFSEAGSRSQFWAPLSTATASNGHVQLDANKSWITGAGEVDSYVWSSKPLAADGASTIWLVQAKAPGLRIVAPFNGLGMRGNSSSPVVAEGLNVDRAALLGKDGDGFNVMMGVVLPYFQLMNAAVSVGIMDAATTKTAAHVGGAKLEHLSQSLADLPTIRAYVARMRVKTDLVRALLIDSVAALEGNRPDAMLRVLEVKAAAGEAATEVTDLGMRVCGGAAFRKEVGVERHFRDARAATVMAPTTDALYEFIGRAVCGLPLF
ncbi:MAG TPA: acyl-CoA dehydrogenase family protein [Aggregatilineales bacterium]|nr:acyl-CoA dehydrogenase family protein [Aggregatilineales bacterium]